MKTTFWVAGLFVVVVILCGCASGPTPTATPAPSPGGTSAPSSTQSATPVATASGTGLGFDAAPWKAGSTTDYEWLDNTGANIGTSQFKFSLSEGVWTIEETDKIGEVDQTIAMEVDAATLAPLGEHKTIHTASNNVEITTQYENGKLDVTAIVDGNTKTASIDVPPDAIDNDQFLMTLRALPFAEGYTATYVVIVAQNALKVNTTVTVQATETIDVAGSSVDAWRVQVSAAQAQQSVWYGVDAPHTLLKYDNGSTQMVLVGQ
jgi:hypothetical protein